MNTDGIQALLLFIVQRDLHLFTLSLIANVWLLSLIAKIDFNENNEN